MTPVVATERDGAVAIAHLNQAESHNALSLAMMERLAELCEEWDNDGEIRCIVIAGSDKYFAAGAELESPEPLLDPVATFFRRLAATQKPIVAAVSGYALGGGFELALACDLVVASENAEFGAPEIQLGLIPGGGATQRLTRAIGKQRAMELVLTGRRIDAEEAHAIGLVNVVTGKRDWFTRAKELAHVVAVRAPIAARLAKRAVLVADETGLEAGLAEERRLYRIAMATEDRVEGMDAFREHRRPRFTGR